jgi:hypothetical protein
MKVIIYHGSNGRCMIYGEIDGELPMPGESVRVRDARMILKVKTVGNLGIAGCGPKPGSDTRITYSVPQTTCTVHSAAECTKEAAEAIDAWPVWQ